MHTRYQQVAMLDTDTGELVERRLEHENGEARAFYAGLTGAVRVGIEATGYTHWFEGLLAELGHELWMGDAAKIRAMVVRKQKTDARDAAHLLELLQAGRFPKIWRPSVAERDLRQLLWHRQKLVWNGTRARVVDGRRGEDSSDSGAQVEDGRAGCGAFARAFGGRKSIAGLIERLASPKSRGD